MLKRLMSFRGWRCLIALASTLPVAAVACEKSVAPPELSAPVSSAKVLRPSELAAADLPNDIGDLTVSVRAALHSRMLRHGDTMENLMWAALMLDAPSVATIASWLENEVGSPYTSEAETSELGWDEVDGAEAGLALPATFRRLEGDLVRKAHTLATVAVARDADGMARAFGQVAESCIRCHAIYLPTKPATSEVD